MKFCENKFASSEIQRYGVSFREKHGLLKLMKTERKKKEMNLYPHSTS